jgi:hypothetical protein
MYMHKVYLVDYILYQNVKIFLRSASWYTKIVVLFKGSHASSARPYYKSSSKIKMDMEHWWNNSGKGSRSSGRRTCLIVTLSTTNFT